MNFPRIASLLLTTLLSVAATDPAAWCGPGQVVVYGGDPHNCFGCYGHGDTASINLADFHDKKVNVVAKPDDSIQCVKFWLKEDGATESYYYNKEKNAPFSLYKNEGLKSFGGEPLVGANQKMFVCTYSDSGCSDKLGCIKVTLDVTDSESLCEPIIDFIDFHDAKADDGFYTWVTSQGQEICLPPSGRVAIQATTCSAGCIDKVYMKLDKHGQSDAVDENTEINEPFSLYKNSGTDFYGRKLPVGDYTITAVPNDDTNYEVSYNFTLVDCTASQPTPSPSDE